MPGKGPNTEGLRQQVDELATSLIVDQGRPAPEALRALSSAFEAAKQEAESSGMGEAAKIAANLAGAVSNAAGSPTADLLQLNQALTKGLDELEKAVAAADQPADGAPSAAPHLPDALANNAIARDPELLNDIILESNEHLASVENELLNLERDPANSEAIHTIFRSFHTIKGLAGFLELTQIQQVAHTVESVLDEARNGKLRITPGITDIILASKDYLERAFRLLAGVLNGAPQQPFEDHQPLLERIRRASQEKQSEEGPQETASPASQASTQATTGEQGETTTREADAVVSAVLESAHTESRTVKVDTAKLDYLVDMIGELVIAQSQVRHDPSLASVESPRLQRNLTQLTRITAELQRTGMAVRMVPVGHLFRRMVRLVRDLSRKSGKKAEIEMIGEDTELDRTIVEELGDPLVHMIRNSVDHGLENPSDRKAAGKDPTGHVRLRASHQAGHILIEIADDGRGINRERVLAKAREKGLITDGSHLSDSEVFNLIFEPGFSTAERVTDISGRGVGMDVVRRHIQKLRGRIEIHSVEGQGTTFQIKLPLTLAIIDGLVIGVGRERYIVPLFAVRETFRPTPEMLSTVLGRGEMALIRGQLLPVARLYRRFGVRPRTEDPCDAVFIVAENGGKFFCLMVDEFIGKQEVVLKSLGETLKNIPGVAGGAILGDGRVGLVLDLDGICEQAHE